MNKRKEEKEEKTRIEEIFSNFSNNLKSLEMFLKNVAPIVTKQDKKAEKKLEKIVDKIKKLAVERIKKTKKEIKTNQKVKEINADKIDKDFDSIIDEFKKMHIAGITIMQGEILYKSSFIMLISYFDFLLSDLIRQYYDLYPSSIYGKDLSLSLSELKDFSSIDDAINFVVEKEIDRILFGNLEKQKKYFKESLNIDLKIELINWGKINEAIERRNIIVHNDGKINKRYLNNIDISVLNGNRKKIKEGERITIDEKYFTSIFNEIFLSGIILIQNCWRIWIKDQVDLQFSQLLLAIYDFLVEEKWENAEKLGLFSKTCKVNCTSNRLFLDINYCQSLKWQGKETKLKGELKKFDISSLSPMYILAISALKGDRETFYKTIENAIIIDNVKKDIFSEWPLFRELREDSDYDEKVQQAFKNISKKKSKK